jgi:hypothetical protein
VGYAYAGPVTDETEERTYRVRIDLADIEPPIWRRLHLSSHLMLDDLHAAIQAAFGWRDHHLHRFATGPSVWDDSSTLYLCPFDVEEGEDEGVPENQVRLDDVLGKPGDLLRYVYDYGDEWEHLIRLESVTARADDVAPAVCVDGERACPPEDCGGPHGYQQLVDAVHAPAEEHDEFRYQMLEESLPYGFRPEHFDREATNEALQLALDPSLRAAAHSPVAGPVLRSLAGRPSWYLLIDLLHTARLHEPVEVDAGTAATAVRRLTWMLDRVGDGGIKLTAAGYLPPRDVEAATTELALEDEFFGKGNREDQTLPVLTLRQARQQLGLVRKYRGRLLLTRSGQRLRNDPTALWWHVVGRVPPHKPDSSEYVAGVVHLVLLAARNDIGSPAALAARVLDDLGWRLTNGQPIEDHVASRAAWDTTAVLEHLGCYEPRRGLARRERPSAVGRHFARAALRGG